MVEQVGNLQNLVGSVMRRYTRLTSQMGFLLEECQEIGTVLETVQLASNKINETVVCVQRGRLSPSDAPPPATTLTPLQQNTGSIPPLPQAPIKKAKTLKRRDALRNVYRPRKLKYRNVHVPSTKVTRFVTKVVKVRGERDLKKNTSVSHQQNSAEVLSIVPVENTTSTAAATTTTTSPEVVEKREPQRAGRKSHPTIRAALSVSIFIFYKQIF